jgi:multidrug transporter EmrE-like cation transporter
MSDQLTLAMLSLIGFCIVMETGREVCFKMTATITTWQTTLLHPITWAGIGCWAIENLAWARVLASVPLSIAFPIMALSYVTIAMSGALIFKETINLQHAAGVALVTLGVICAGVTGL